MWQHPQAEIKQFGNKLSLYNDVGIEQLNTFVKIEELAHEEKCETWGKPSEVHSRECIAGRIGGLGNKWEKRFPRHQEKPWSTAERSNSPGLKS